MSLLRAGNPVLRPTKASAERIARTDGRFERQTECDNFVVRLEDVKPYPKEGATIAPGDYRATVVVARR